MIRLKLRLEFVGFSVRVKIARLGLVCEMPCNIIYLLYKISNV